MDHGQHIKVMQGAGFRAFCTVLQMRAARFVDELISGHRISVAMDHPLRRGGLGKLRIRFSADEYLTRE